MNARRSKSRSAGSTEAMLRRIPSPKAMTIPLSGIINPVDRRDSLITQGPCRQPEQPQGRKLSSTTGARPCQQIPSVISETTSGSSCCQSQGRAGLWGGVDVQRRNSAPGARPRRPAWRPAVQRPRGFGADPPSRPHGPPAHPRSPAYPTRGCAHPPRKIVAEANINKMHISRIREVPLRSGGWPNPLINGIGLTQAPARPSMPGQDRNPIRGRAR
jgi:hypothetical protein